MNMRMVVELLVSGVQHQVRRRLVLATARTAGELELMPK